MRAVARLAWETIVVVFYALACIGGFFLIWEGAVANTVLGVFGIATFASGVVIRVLRLRRERPRSSGVPSQLPDEEHTDDWFPEDEGEENRFTVAQTALVDRLRERALNLPCGDVWSEARQDRGELFARITVTDAGFPALLNVGIRFANGVLHGDRLHHEMLPVTPSPDVITASGSDDELIEHAINWFECMLRRPVECLEWWYAGRPYAVRYQFADTREGLVEAFDPKRAPRRVRRRLTTKTDEALDLGVAPSNLGKPSATVAVRVGGRTLTTRPLSEFDWHFS